MGFILNTRLIPVIVLLINIFIPFLFIQLETGLSTTLLIVAFWSFVSMFCLILVAYWVYEDGKKINSSDTYLWRRIEKMEESEKMTERFIEELETRIKKLEEKEKGE